MSYEHTYKLKYGLTMESGNFTQNEIFKENAGGADALLIFSILYPDDGSYSIRHISKDGRTDKPLDDTELFKVWTMLAAFLETSTGLRKWQRELINDYMITIREIMAPKKPNN